MTYLLLSSFVALDLETTGLDPGSDEIIEVAAVRFDEGRETAVFCELVYPGRPVPPRVRNLTGIHDGMLQDKPPIGPVFARLQTFIGDLPLVAHNADFDLAFLRAAAARSEQRLSNHCYDTVELARIAAPLSKNHRLATLTSALRISHHRAHRAEDDARATGHLFVGLLRRLQQADLGLLHALLHLGEPIGWSLAPLVRTMAEERAAAGEKARSLMQWIRPADGPLHRSDDQDEPEELPRLDVDALCDILAPGGLVADAFPSYEHRPQQLEMVQAVSDSLNEGHHLLMEAGTGTGKSLAYLLPAFAWAKATGEKVVVSTHTINLQEQLWEKDIPFLQQALEGSELDGISAALVKGRSNYVCLRKWEEAATGAGFLALEDERRFHIRMAAWLSETETGDRAELNLTGESERLWYSVMSETETCLGPRCKWYKNHCFAFRARRRAADADILIVNHSLLFSNIAADNAVLPRFRHLVIDEAHHVEQVATQSLGINLSHLDLIGALAYLFRGFRAESGPGLLTQLRRKVGRPLPARPPIGSSSEDHLERLIDRVQAARSQADELFRLLYRLAEEHGATEEDGGRSLRLVPSLREGNLWDGIDAARANLVHSLLTLAQGLTSLCDILEEMAPPLRDLDGLVADIQKQRSILGESALDINTVLLTPPEETVTWIEVGGRRDQPRVALRLAPIDVGPLLREKLFDRMRAVVMTSATLSVGTSFDHLKLRLGLSHLGADRLGEGMVDSPFRYQQQALLCVPDDLPNPKNEREFTRAVQEFLREFLVAVGGRTLVLFTSHRQLRQIYQGLRDDLGAEGIALLGQGIDGGRGRLVEEFKADERSVLFGSSSFWEGVDIPGDGLSCVVMVRLPFAPPDDPVMAARIEDLDRRGISSFRSLSLPQAVLRFKQGFGRLVRTSSDRGVVVVLDNRILRGVSPYGATFLRSLPGPQRFAGSRQRVVERAVTWLNMEMDD